GTASRGFALASRGERAVLSRGRFVARGGTTPDGERDEAGEEGKGETSSDEHKELLSMHRRYASHAPRAFSRRGAWMGISGPTDCVHERRHADDSGCEIHVTPTRQMPFGRMIRSAGLLLALGVGNLALFHQR